jgi:hypothetical protein
MDTASHRSEVALPPLSIADWRPTQETLHLFTQIVGKVRAATAPPRNHWWHVALYVNSRGLTTGPLLQDGRTFEILLDLSGHQLVVETVENETRGFPLREGLSVATSTCSFTPHSRSSV